MKCDTTCFTLSRDCVLKDVNIFQHFVSFQVKMVEIFILKNLQKNLNQCIFIIRKINSIMSLLCKCNIECVNDIFKPFFYLS